MLCLSGFELYSRWVPLGSWEKFLGFNFLSPLVLNLDRVRWHYICHGSPSASIPTDFKCAHIFRNINMKFSEKSDRYRLNGGTGVIL